MIDTKLVTTALELPGYRITPSTAVYSEVYRR